MSKHLTLTDRAIIEKHIAQDMSFAYIARCLNRSATTISREVKNHRCFVNGVRYTSNDCALIVKLNAGSFSIYSYNRASSFTNFI